MASFYWMCLTRDGGFTWVPHFKEIIANLVFKRRECEVQREWERERECSECLYLHLRFLGSHNRIQRERCILFSTLWLLHGLQWVLFFLFSLLCLLSIPICIFWCIVSGEELGGDTIDILRLPGDCWIYSTRKGGSWSDLIRWHSSPLSLQWSFFFFEHLF